MHSHSPVAPARSPVMGERARWNCTIHELITFPTDEPTPDKTELPGTDDDDDGKAYFGVAGEF